MHNQPCLVKYKRMSASVRKKIKPNSSFLFLQKLRCQRKEPCRLFSVRKNADHQVKKELVNTSSLCQCPHRKKCPRHHLDVGVIPGKVYSEDNLRTYSAYCM